MRGRLHAVHRLLKREKADALLVWNHEGSGQPATCWLSGFTGSQSILLLLSSSRYLITDGRYTLQSRREASGFRVHIVSGKRAATEKLRSIVRSERVTSLLFDGGAISYAAVEDLKTLMSDVRYIGRERILQELRIVKQKSELAALREASRIACDAFMGLLPHIRAGITERELASRLEALCIEAGAEALAFPIIIASGVNGAEPHARSTDKKLRKGELIIIDFGVRYKGYVSDMTRTVALGRVSSRLHRIYEIVRRAQERACRAVRAGVTEREVDAACRFLIKRNGYGTYFSHATGHGIGMEVHELPVISKLGEKTLPAGAVITCEPGVYIPKVGGVRIEDALIVTKSGSINLTDSVTRELIVV